MPMARIARLLTNCLANRKRQIANDIDTLLTATPRNSQNDDNKESAITYCCDGPVRSPSLFDHRSGGSEVRRIGRSFVREDSE